LTHPPSDSSGAGFLFKPTSKLIAFRKGFEDLSRTPKTVFGYSKTAVMAVFSRLFVFRIFAKRLM
jgi:hypothetical protein